MKYLVQDLGEEVAKLSTKYHNMIKQRKMLLIYFFWMLISGVLCAITGAGFFAFLAYAAAIAVFITLNEINKEIDECKTKLDNKIEALADAIMKNAHEMYLQLTKETKNESSKP